MAECECDEPASKVEWLGRLGACSSTDLCDFAQNVPGPDRWVILRHGIASSDPTAVFADETMNQQPAGFPDNDDIARFELLRTCALDQQHITGPDARKHATA